MNVNKYLQKISLLPPVAIVVDIKNMMKVRKLIFKCCCCSWKFLIQKIFWVIFLGRISRILITKWVNEHFTIIDAIKIRLFVEKLTRNDEYKYVCVYVCIHTQTHFHGVEFKIYRKHSKKRSKKGMKILINISNGVDQLQKYSHGILFQAE